jgi:hypothetical protein
MHNNTLTATIFPAVLVAAGLSFLSPLVPFSAQFSTPSTAIPLMPTPAQPSAQDAVNESIRDTVRQIQAVAPSQQAKTMDDAQIFTQISKSYDDAGFSIGVVPAAPVTTPVAVIPTAKAPAAQPTTWTPPASWTSPPAMPGFMQVPVLAPTQSFNDAGIPVSSDATVSPLLPVSPEDVTTWNEQEQARLRADAQREQESIDEQIATMEPVMPPVDVPADMHPAAAIPSPLPTSVSVPAPPSTVDTQAQPAVQPVVSADGRIRVETNGELTVLTPGTTATAAEGGWFATLLRFLGF